MATQLDILTLALRQISVIAIDEDAEAEDFAYAKAIYDGEVPRMLAAQGMATLDQTAEVNKLPLAHFVASKLTMYGVALPGEAKAIAQLRATAFPDDREDRADLDEDGTVTDAEQDASERAAFY